MRKNEQGFALVLSLVLMLAMSLMGGALIVISAGDHQSNNKSDEYQQTFYIAETALIEGEKYVLNQFLGPWSTQNHTRDTSKRNLPANNTQWNGNMANYRINYNSSNSSLYYNTENFCANSFKDLDKVRLSGNFYDVVAAQSWNFGKLVRDSFNSATNDERKEAEKLYNYFYEFFVIRIGAAPFRGTGSSIKKGSTDKGNDGMAYRIYGCGLKKGNERMVVALESVIVLPK